MLFSCACLKTKHERMFIFVALPTSDSSPLLRVKRMKGKNGVSCVLDTAERRYRIVPPKKRLHTPIYFIASPVTYIALCLITFCLININCVFVKLDCILYAEYLISERRRFTFVVFLLPLVSEQEGRNVEMTEITILQQFSSTSNFESRKCQPRNVKGELYIAVC